MSRPSSFVVALLALLVPLVAGCSHRNSRSVAGPDGRSWWAVTCSHGQDNCWEEAAERCPGGYVTADEGNATSVGAAAVGGTLVAVPKQHGEMLIACK